MYRMGSEPAAAHEVQFVDSPRQVWHVALQERQTPSPTVAERNWPTAQTVVHVPALASCVAPATQEVQPEEVPSEHVAHVASHAVHVLLASAYLPLGQLATHEPSSKLGVPLLGQVIHAALDTPEHVAHVAWQSVHVACAPTISTKVPLLGHSEMHAPPERKGALVPEHVMHSVADGPEHVPHVAWHASHTPLLLAYLPTGVHDERQLPRPEPR